MSRSRRFLLPLLVTLAASAFFAPTALAVPFNDGSTGPGNESGRCTGTCKNTGKVTYNDVNNLKRQQFLWTDRIHDDFFARGCKRYRLGLTYKCSLNLGPGSSASRIKGDDGGWVGHRTGGKRLYLNKKALNTVSFRNKCRFGPPKQLRINPLGQREGSNCWFRGESGWNNIHGAAPGEDPKVQGGTSFITVRLWRSCEVIYARGDDGKPVFDGFRTSSGISDECPNTPILERIPPQVDNTSTAARNYWRTARNGDGVPVATTSSSHSAFSQTPALTAGVLYKNCTGDLCSEGAEWVGKLKNTNSTNFQRSCRNGVLSGTQPNWSQAEMLAQLEYSKEHWRNTILDVPLNNKIKPKSARLADAEKRREALQQRIEDWIKGKSGGKLPALMSASSANVVGMCRLFSEFLGLDWKTGSSGSSVSLSGNLIPNRLYLATYSFLDSRENIISQKIQYFASSASGPDPKCIPGVDAECTETYPRFTSGPVDGTIWASLPRAGFVGTRSVASVGSTASQPMGLEDGLNCDPYDPAYLDGSDPETAEPDWSKMPALCPKEFDSEWPEPGTDAEEDIREVLFIDPNNYSLWTPRAAAFGVYNPLDHEGRASQSYEQTHELSADFASAGSSPERGLGRGGSNDRLFGPFVEGESPFNKELASQMQSRPLYSLMMPLGVDDANGNVNDVVGSAKVTVDRTTETPKSSNGQVRAAQRWDADETRAVAVIGENRYQRATWEAGRDNLTKREWRRLTMDSCEKTFTNTLLPSLELNDGRITGCNAGAKIGGSDWTVKDAYRVPGAGTGAPTRFLDVLFTQERLGTAIVDFRLSETPNLAWLQGAVARIEIFTAEDYRNDPSTPTYTAPGTRGVNGDERIIAFGNNGWYGPESIPTRVIDGAVVTELPQGQYIARLVVDGSGGYPPFTWGALANTYTNTQQQWVSRFDVKAEAATAPIYRTRNAG